MGISLKSCSEIKSNIHSPFCTSLIHQNVHKMSKVLGLLDEWATFDSQWDRQYLWPFHLTIPHVFTWCSMLQCKMETTFCSCHWPVQKVNVLVFFPLFFSESSKSQSVRAKLDRLHVGPPKSLWLTEAEVSHSHWQYMIFRQRESIRGACWGKLPNSQREVQGYLATPTSCWQRTNASGLHLVNLGWMDRKAKK